MITKNKLIRTGEELFEHIEDQIGENSQDFDCQLVGNVLTIKAVDDTQVIVNRHMPNQKLQIIAKSGGYHFVEQNSKWLAIRDGQDFYDVLNKALGTASDGAVEIAEL